MRFIKHLRSATLDFASRAPASLLLAGVASPPVAGDGIAGTGEPFLVVPELFQRFRGKELRAVAGGMAERFQQACRYEPGNLVRFKTEKPRRLICVEPGGNDLPTEKFRLLRGHIHTVVMVEFILEWPPRERGGTNGFEFIFRRVITRFHRANLPRPVLAGLFLPPCPKVRTAHGIHAAANDFRRWNSGAGAMWRGPHANGARRDQQSD